MRNPPNKAESTMLEFIRISVLGRGDVPMDIRKGALEVIAMFDHKYRTAADVVIEGLRAEVAALVWQKRELEGERSKDITEAVIRGRNTGYDLAKRDYADLVRACRDIHVHGATDAVVSSIVKALSVMDNEPLCETSGAPTSDKPLDKTPRTDHEYQNYGYPRGHGDPNFHYVLIEFARGLEREINMLSAQPHDFRKTMADSAAESQRMSAKLARYEQADGQKVMDIREPKPTSEHGFP